MYMNNQSIKPELELLDLLIKQAIDDINSGKYIIHEDLVKKLMTKQ